ncbi:MAG: phage holin family protein [Clostridiaceae bacterium]|nr:phage holin family protein [Clostridiaceae bacterium]
MEQKGFLALVGVVVSFITGSISIPMVVLLILIILDYILGMAAAIKEEAKFDWRKAVWGAVKKVGYAVVILFAILVDLLLLQGINEIGWDVPFRAIFSVAATVYLCGIEFFSGCRHLLTLGVPVPGFLVKFAEFLTEKAEKVMDPDGDQT